MEQYISKSALVAKLEKRIKETESMQPKFDQFWAGQISAFKGVLKILDTIETKEVDLEEEVRKWQQKHFEGIGYVLDGSGGWIGRTSLFDIAEHFFELGFKSK